MVDVVEVEERALTFPCLCAQVFSSGSWPPFKLTVPGLSVAFSRNWCLCSHCLKMAVFKIDFSHHCYHTVWWTKREYSLLLWNTEVRFHTQALMSKQGLAAVFFCWQCSVTQLGELWHCWSLTSKVTCPFSPSSPSLDISGSFQNSDGDLSVGSRIECIWV